ncbi:MAG: hypothetical protein AAGU12_00255 [Clostridiales bacterium]
MSQYIHEIVLQEYIIEHISSMELSVKYKNEYQLLVDARSNKTGTFWDLEGKLSNGIWIPVEVEWISQNFIAHKHDKSADFPKFKELNGVILVVRENKKIPNVQQISILSSANTETQFKKSFKKWFKLKSDEYIDSTLEDFMVGNYIRNIPRIVLYPISNAAHKNYFADDGSLYKRDPGSPSLLGFKEDGYEKNIFVRDLQPNDICVMIDADGRRGKRKIFIDSIKQGDLNVKKIVAYKVTSKLSDKRLRQLKGAADDLYWKDEIKANRLIYPYICHVEAEPFFHKENIKFPYIEDYSENTWEDFCSCIQYGVYREINALDFTLLISNM